MQADQHPIPPESLPPGWGLADVDADRLVYRRRSPALELLGEQTGHDQAHPGLGIGRCWAVKYRLQVGELPVCETVDHVPTRRAAVRGLLACMHHIHECVEDASDPLGVQAALEDLDLVGCLPELS